MDPKGDIEVRCVRGRRLTWAATVIPANGPVELLAPDANVNSDMGPTAAWLVLDGPELMGLCNAINATAMYDRPALPDDCRFRRLGHEHLRRCADRVVVARPCARPRLARRCVGAAHP
jgi:hypothetical protein